AMGSGASLALAAADSVLVCEGVAALPRAIETARRTMKIAKQNLVWAAAYNFCGLPLAALGLIPPWVAAIGMSLSSVAVVLNAMRVGQGLGAWGSGQKEKRRLRHVQVQSGETNSSLATAHSLQPTASSTASPTHAPRPKPQAL